MAGPESSLLSPQWAGTPVAELTSDRVVLQYFLDIERAWLEVLARNGLEVSATRADLEALEVTNEWASAVAQNSWQAGNPAVGFVEHVRGALSDGARAEDVFHRGLTSQDIVDTAMMMMAKSVLLQIRADIYQAGVSLANLSSDWAQTICVTKTLTRHAEPSALGFRFATWLGAVVDALEIIDEQVPRLRVQLAGAVGNRAAMAGLGEEVDANSLVADMARTLKLGGPTEAWHSNRIPALSLSYALAAAASSLGTIAHNLIALGRPEVGELVENVPPGQGTSSAMPHKKNPTRSILAHSVSVRIPGVLAQIQAAAAPVAERGEGQWNAEWEPLRDLMRLVAGQAHHTREVLGNLRVDEDAVASNLAHAGLADVGLSDQALAQMDSERDQIVARFSSLRKDIS